MQWLSSCCYTASALIKLGGNLYQGQIWYTGVGPHILLYCPILPSSADSVATYSRKTPKIKQFSHFEFTGGAT